MMYDVVPVLLILCTIGRKALSNLQESDPKCRYRVHFPKASWHTAYDVCAGENKTLAKISSQIEIQLVDLVLLDVEKLIEQLEVKTDLQGVWIEGFRRSSNNETMQQNCRSLDPTFNIVTAAEDDILCLYYNYTDKKFYADDCSTNRTFLCESMTTDLENCMMNNGITSVVNNRTNGICELRSTANLTLEECKSGCLKDSRCYAIEHSSSSCREHMYKHPTSRCYFWRDTKYIDHKGLFIYHPTSPSPAAAKLFKEWCPEITQEIIQEKIENIQKNLTVNKKETNQYIRTLTSAPDERQSAKNIGIVGVTVISVVFGVIMLSDCINVVRGIQNKCKRSEDS